MSIVIYTANNCPYCEQAKKFFKRKNVVYKEYDVSNNPEQRQSLIKKSKGLKTVPQIFIDELHIGGYDDLKRLEIQGNLQQLIKNYFIVR